MIDDDTNDADTSDNRDNDDNSNNMIMIDDDDNSNIRIINDDNDYYLAILTTWTEVKKMVFDDVPMLLQNSTFSDG